MNPQTHKPINPKTRYNQASQGTLLHESESTSQPIILFDGVCNLCDHSVQFIIQRDHQRRFKFAALQSVAGQRLLREQGLPTEEFRSIVLLEGGKLWQKSSAALRIARRLSGLWPLLYLLILVPAPIRDFIYDCIATRRYRWFGKKETCLIPTPELRSRFLS